MLTKYQVGVNLSDFILKNSFRKILLGFFALFATHSFADGIFETNNSRTFAAENTYTVGAIGDSITTAFNALRPTNNKRLSWSSGSENGKVFSHYFRLKEVYSDKVFREYNYAVPGKTSEELLQQIQKLNKHDPDYVAFTIGTNDVCGTEKHEDFNTERFKSNLRRGLDALIKKNPDIKIVMSLIPNVLQLREFDGKVKSCALVRKIITFAGCANALHPDLSEQEIASFDVKRHAANKALLEITQEYSKNVRSVPLELAETRYELDDVSKIDCFHPSIKGQNKFAEATWEHGWYPEKKH